MKWILILQLMTFSPDGELLNKSTFKRYFETQEQCASEMNTKFEEFQKTYETSPHVGIIGKCVES